MDPQIQSHLLKTGFQQHEDGTFQKASELQLVVSEFTPGELVLEIGVLDPFFEGSPPLYALCVRGELLTKGVLMSSPFMTISERARGKPTNDVNAFQEF